MAIEHNLEMKQSYLDNLIHGRKKVLIGLNDLDYQLGDKLIFYDHSQERAVKYMFEITHIHSGVGMEKDFVALSVKPIKN